VELLPGQQAEALGVYDLDPQLNQLRLRQAKVVQEALQSDVLLLIEHCIFVLNIDAKCLYYDLLHKLCLSIKHLFILIEGQECDAWLGGSISPLYQVAQFAFQLFLLHLRSLGMCEL
jgi:hypothetical protein